MTITTDAQVQPHGFSLTAIETPIFNVNDDLVAFIVNHVDSGLVTDGMILAVTSKIVSLAEGRTVPRGDATKLELIKREADTYIGPMEHGGHLTMKHGLLLASAGIDESNSQNGDYILYPENPFASATHLWKSLREKWKIQDLGILLTDSRTAPLRLGVTGFALAYCGFRGLQQRIGEQDLFGRELRATSVNVADGLAAIATLFMGEAAESRPLAVMHSTAALGLVEFSDQPTTVDEIRVEVEDDLYRRLLLGGMNMVMPPK